MLLRFSDKLTLLTNNIKQDLKIYVDTVSTNLIDCMDTSTAALHSMIKALLDLRKKEINTIIDNIHQTQQDTQSA